MSTFLVSNVLWVNWRRVRFQSITFVSSHRTRTHRFGLLTLSTWSIARCCLVYIYRYTPLISPIPREPDGDRSRSSDSVPGHPSNWRAAMLPGHVALATELPRDSNAVIFVPAVFFCFCYLGWSPKHMREWRRTHMCSTDPFQDCGEPQISISFAQQKIERRGVGFHLLELNVWISDIWVWKPCPQCVFFFLCFCWALPKRKLRGRSKEEEEDQQEAEEEISEMWVQWCTAQPHTLCAAGHAAGRGFFVPAVPVFVSFWLGGMSLLLFFFCCVFLFWSITQAHARVTQNTRVFHWSFSGLWRTSNKYKLCSTKNWVRGVGFH